jgi:flagellar assembly protein FliH
MSSRILEPDAPIEPKRWHPSGADHTYSTPPAGSRGQALPADSSDSGGDYQLAAAQSRVRELESSIKLLEQRIGEERAKSKEQGHQQGVAAGAQMEAAKWSEAIARLGRSIEEISKTKARLRAEVEEDAVKLALAIARKILNRELASDPEALLGLARVALDKLNQRELQRVRVHPSDAAGIERLLAASAGPKRVEVISDGSLERGAAIFETERGVLDASVTTQLGEIERGLTDMLGSAKSP